MPATSEANASRPISGTVDGKSFHAKDGTFIVDHGGSVVSIELSDFADVCAAVSAGAPPPRSAMLELDVMKRSGELVAPGVFPLAKAPGELFGANVAFTRFDAKGNMAHDANATDGTLTITAIGKTTLSGSVDATFAHGSVHGTFTARVCAR